MSTLSITLDGVIIPYIYCQTCYTQKRCRHLNHEKDNIIQLINAAEMIINGFDTNMNILSVLVCVPIIIAPPLVINYL
jgi:hypothetical protein